MSRSARVNECFSLVEQLYFSYMRFSATSPELFVACQVSRVVLWCQLLPVAWKRVSVNFNSLGCVPGILVEKCDVAEFVKQQHGAG